MPVLLLGEASTIKARAQAMLRDADRLLNDKALPDSLTGPLKALRTALKARWADLADTSSQESADATLLPLAAARLLAEAPDVLRQDDSLDSLRDRVWAALRQWAAMQAAMLGDRPGEYGSWAYIRDLFPDSVVFDWEGSLYQAAYTVDADGVVMLGEPSPVQIAYVPVSTETSTTEQDAELPAPNAAPAAESITELVGDLVPLREAAAVQPDGSARVKLIASDIWGSSGYYGRDVLERDGPQVFKAGTLMFLDHATERESAERPEGSLKNLAAVLTSDASYSDGPDGPGLYADAHVLDQYRGFVNEIAPYTGVSIRAFGKAQQGEAQGRQGAIITALTQAESVDLVTKPGADGKVLALYEAARGRTPQQESAPPPAAEEDSVSEQALQEARAAADAALAEAQAARAENARLREAMLLTQARDHAARELARIPGLHALTQERLAAQLVTQAPIVEGALDIAAFTTAIREAAAAELAYLAETTGIGSGRPVGMGSTPTEPLTEADAQKALAEAVRGWGLTEQQAAAFAAGR